MLTHEFYEDHKRFNSLLRLTFDLPTRQGLLMSNALRNFVADYPQDYLDYFPTCIGGTASKSVDHPHLATIKKYALMISLLN